MIEDIGKLAQQERLQAMEALWDALIHDDPEPASPTWHEETLASRRAKIDSGAASFVALDALKADRRG